MAKLTEEDRAIVEYVRKIVADFHKNSPDVPSSGIRIFEEMVRLIDRLAQEPDCEGCKRDRGSWSCDKCSRNFFDRYERKDVQNGE